MHKDLGYRGLITEINFKENAVISEIRDTLAFVDNHKLLGITPNSLPGHSWSFPFLLQPDERGSGRRRGIPVR